jgi:hypothetical protein
MQALLWVPYRHRALGAKSHAVLHAFILGLRQLQGKGGGDRMEGEGEDVVVHVDPAAVEYMLESAHKAMFGKRL